AARLDGLDLVGAHAELHIPSGDPVPLDIDGQTLGDVDCDVTLKVEGARGGTGMKVNVDIPRLHVTLPLASSNAVQELGEAEKVHVGFFRKPRQFVLLPKDAEDLESRAPSSAPP